MNRRVLYGRRRKRRLGDGFNDVEEGDILEVFETREVERTSLDEAPSAATT